MNATKNTLVRLTTYADGSLAAVVRTHLGNEFVHSGTREYISKLLKNRYNISI